MNGYSAVIPPVHEGRLPNDLVVSPTSLRRRAEHAIEIAVDEMEDRSLELRDPARNELPGVHVPLHRLDHGLVLVEEEVEEILVDLDLFAEARLIEMLWWQQAVTNELRLARLARPDGAALHRIAPRDEGPVGQLESHAGPVPGLVLHPRHRPEE